MPKFRNSIIKGGTIGVTGLGFALISDFALEHVRWPEEIKGLAQGAAGIVSGAVVEEMALAKGREVNENLGLGLMAGGVIGGGVRVSKGLRVRAYLAQLATPSQRRATTQTTTTNGTSGGSTQTAALGEGSSSSSSNTTQAAAGVYAPRRR
jgi:hypothetical protein